ncbi:hypothetical protein KBTX_03918 [wastewater metagenome]|uniref:Uncharacterized protein n=2 Tax=unclassified sequences TaxID=12908 RepID=A0A5B8RFC7_9ZZZZ|nr:hypothetical protein KBTEX_03918 [uncultured organism]
MSSMLTCPLPVRAVAVTFSTPSRPCTASSTGRTTPDSICSGVAPG